MTAPTIVRLTAQPRLLTDGSLQTLRMAGGGNRSTYYLNSNHYRAGIVDLPRFSAAFGWDEDGWNGNARPQIANLLWSPSVFADVASWSGLYLWKDAPITAELGVELEVSSGSAEPSSWTTILTGKVQQVGAGAGQITFQIADNGASLDQPLVTIHFAGTGGVEGPAEAEGRDKRRSYGYVFNVEGRILDKVNNIWEFGDPSQQLQAISAVRDIGRAASPTPTSVAWQGSVAATLTALQASSPVAGSGVVAPSIGCVKWWTQPVGPLTADLIGAGDYGNTACALAKHLAIEAGLTMVSVPGSISSLMANVANAGVHVGDDRMTIANALDRLLLGSGIFWRFTPAGVLDIQPIQVASPTETVLGDNIQRQRVLAPHRTRRLGYARNERVMSPGEIAAVILSGDIGDLPAAVGTLVAVADGNRVRYSLFEKGTVGWVIGRNSTGGSPTLTTLANNNKQFIRLQGSFTANSQEASIATGEQAAFNSGFQMPVTAGERLLVMAMLRVDVLASPKTWALYIVYRDSAGTPFGTQAIANGVGTLLPETLKSAFVTVPSGAVTAYLEFIVGSATGGAGSFDASLAKPQVSSAGSAQTAIPAFTPGPSSDMGANVGAVGDANRTRYSLLEKGLVGWASQENSGVSPSLLTTGVITSGPAGGMAYIQANANFTASGQTLSIGSDTGAAGYYPVTAGERIFAGAQFGITGLPAGSTYDVVLCWLNAAGTEVGLTRTVISSGSAVGGFGLETRFGAFITVPAGAVSCFWRFHVYANAASSGFSMFVAQPMVTGAAIAQVGFPAFSPGPGNEPGAELTRTVDGPQQALTFKYDYLGAKDGWSTRDLTWKLNAATGQITSGVSWSWKVKSGNVNGITSAGGAQSMTSVSSGTATLTVSSLSTNSTIEVTATYNGLPYGPKSNDLTREDGIPPISTGGGGTVTIDSDTSGYPNFNSTTFATVSTLSGVLPTGKTAITISTALTVTPTTAGGAYNPGANNVEMKILRDNGGGSFTQIGSTQQGSTYYFPSSGGDPADMGTYQFNYTPAADTGLTAGNTYTYLIQLRLTTGTRLHGVSGTTSETA